MSDYKLAKPRWEVTGDDTIVFEDGSEHKLPAMPLEVIERLATLPQDYIELGNHAADLKWDAEQAVLQRENVQRSYDALIERLDAAEGKNKENLLVVLQEDLELAINLVLRFARALGVQAGGSLYEEIQAIANKYKMSYEAPTSNNLYRNLNPAVPIHPVWTDEVFHGHEEARAEGPEGEIFNVRFNSETGRLDIEPVEGD